MAKCHLHILGEMRVWTARTNCDCILLFDIPNFELKFLTQNRSPQKSNAKKCLRIVLLSDPEKLRFLIGVLVFQVPHTPVPQVQEVVSHLYLDPRVRWQIECQFHFILKIVMKKLFTFDYFPGPPNIVVPLQLVISVGGYPTKNELVSIFHCFCPWDL
jgi:hypothetical protein